MSTIAAVLRKVPPDVIVRNLALASDRVVEGRPILQQLEAAMSIPQGKDVLVSLPTGYSKTLIYQLLPVTAEEIL